MINSADCVKLNYNNRNKKRFKLLHKSDARIILEIRHYFQVFVAKKKVMWMVRILKTVKF